MLIQFEYDLLTENYSLCVNSIRNGWLHFSHFIIIGSKITCWFHFCFCKHFRLIRATKIRNIISQKPFMEMYFFRIFPFPGLRDTHFEHWNSMCIKNNAIWCSRSSSLGYLIIFQLFRINLISISFYGLVNPLFY